MRNQALIALILMTFLACCEGDASSSKKNEAAANFPIAEAVLTDVSGSQVTPFAEADVGTIAVLIFLYPDCPIANAYAPEFLRLRQHFAGRPTTWHFVHADPKLELDAIQTHAEQFRLDEARPTLAAARVWLDQDHDAVRATGASVTPEAVVMRRESEGWRMNYRGRIDDLFVDFGQRRAKASTSDLREAVERALSKDSQGLVLTKAIGCYIEPSPR